MDSREVPAMDSREVQAMDSREVQDTPVRFRICPGSREVKDMSWIP